MKRLAALVLLCLTVLVIAPAAAPASADAIVAGADTSLAQTIAGTELTVVIRSTPKVPAALPVVVFAHQPVPDLTIALTVRSTETGRVATGAVRLVRGRAGAYPAAIRVQETGPHELELRAAREFSVLPFRVLVARASPWEFVIHGGLYAAGALLIGGMLTGGLARRASAAAVGGGAAIGVAAITVALLSSRLPPSLPDGAAPAPPSPVAGRPYAMAAIHTTPERPVAGAELVVRLDLVDGSTGRPVDDLAVHHAAPAHLVITSEDGAFFRHLHPLRTAPGRLEVRLRPDRPGRYLAYAEIERDGSGGQLLQRRFTVAAAPGRPAVQDEPEPATAPGGLVAVAGTTPADEPGATPDAGATADPSGAAGGPSAGPPGGFARPVTTPAPPVAGRPATIELDVGGGRLQPWLGMAGHLIVRDQDGGFMGHVHEMGSMAQTSAQPDEGSAVYEPRLRFTFSFPAPGRYLGWVQYARDFRVVTVPFSVTVAPGDGAR
ncbi:hypothetical protein [Sphaerisporangium dianthi]|uniref:Secreted protein n=1 Tax=Sphaerisporangium dianthi TaxID=1436120 RepID=A0ABV9CNX9_9ACTN